jgi:hypothetical protein
MPKTVSAGLDANKLHERAREGSFEYHKLLTQLSTGVLAIYFLALTSSTEPPLSPNQQIAALCSLTLMGLSVFFGILFWLSDALRNYYWGASLELTDKKKQEVLYKQKQKWQRVIRVGTWGMSIFFLLGMASSIWYMVLRVYGL